MSDYAVWTPEIVQSRFVEAADTERYLPIDRLGNGAGFWPKHFYDKEDRDGWDDVAQLENAQRPASRAPTGAVSRHEECMRWTTDFIPEERRHLVWAYARCRAFNWEFSSLCSRRGWVKSTAYDRLNKIWDALSLEFCSRSLHLHLPAQNWIGHEGPEIGSFSIGSGATRVSPTAIPNKPYRTEKSVDLIRSNQDAENFAAYLDARNELCREEQARREKLRRRKLGMEKAA